MTARICGECKQIINTGNYCYDVDYVSHISYYSCREKDCEYDVCRDCAYRGIRHEHREFDDNTPTFMMTTLNGRTSNLVEEDDDNGMSSLCGMCHGPVSNNTHCKKCKAPYCSHECLKKDWNRHRPFCIKPK